MSLPEVTKMEPMGDLRLIRLPRVKELTSLGKTTIYSRLHAGRFPDRMKLSPTVSAWRYADVMAWIEEQGAAA